MLATINDGIVDICVDFTALIQVVLEPGIWVISHRGTEYSITHLACRLIDSRAHFAFPKGVARKNNGAWSAQERILPDALPLDARAWRTLPADVRSALEDAYLLARHELPEQVGAS
jgi:hypothetical protein